MMIINFNANKLEFVNKMLGVNPISRRVFNENEFNRVLKRTIYRELLSSYETFRRQALDHMQTSINNEIIRCGLCKSVNERFGNYLAHTVTFEKIVEEIRVRTIYNFKPTNYVKKAFHLCRLAEYLEKASGIASLIDFNTVPDELEPLKNRREGGVL